MIERDRKMQRVAYRLDYTLPVPREAMHGVIGRELAA